MHAIGSGGERPTAQFRIVVLSDREGRRASSLGALESLDAVVGAGGQVDDDPIDIGQRPLETRCRPDGDRDPIARSDEVGQARGPDQVIREDRDPRRQSSVSARWWKTSRAVMTPVGRPSSTIGM